MTKHLVSTTILCGAMLAASSALAQDTGYCDQGYAAADSDGDDMISETELQMLKDAEFNDMDADGDGIVTAAEFNECVATWPSTAAPASSDEADMMQLDVNDDGKLSADEFMGQTEAASMAETSDTPQAVIIRNLILVPAGDDGSGMDEMTSDEMAVRSAQRFVTTDADGDREISREEWIDMGQSNVNKIETVLEREFESLDADGSGDVSRQEYYDRGVEQWERARLSAEDKGATEGDATGAPVVYYRFNSTM